MRKTKDSDIPILYSLRAIAAISVCLCHFIERPYFQDKELLDVFFIGKYGVEMFFIISGFIIPWSMYQRGYVFKSFFTFLFKRLVRLEPPYIASIIITLLMLLLRHEMIPHTTAETPSYVQIALHFGYLIPFFKQYSWLQLVYWTLAIEFQFYLFMAFIYTPLSSGKLWIRLLFYVFTFATTYFLGLPLTQFFRFLPQCFAFFMLGILLFLKKVKSISSLEYYIVTITLLIYCLFKYTLGCELYLIVAVIGILFFEKSDNKLLRPIGQISYSIYLFHATIGLQLMFILYRHTDTILSKTLMVLATCVLTWVSSYLMYVFVERPSKRLSEKLNY